MARTHAEAFQKIDGVELVAGVDNRPDVLARFCADFSIPNRFAGLDEAIAWDGFDAAANVTPDAAHHATTLSLLKAGKHVLCEKPLATNAADAREMADLAAASRRIGMVNLSYRNVAVLQKAAELVSSGAIGALRHFEASYLQSWLTQPPGETGRRNRNGCGACRRGMVPRASSAMSAFISSTSSPSPPAARYRNCPAG
jgi:predicted dehydrogenase